MSADEVLQNGWTAVPLDAGIIFSGKPFINPPEPLLAADIEFPSAKDPIVKQVQEHAQKVLTRQTYNHSMRVYYFATAIIKQQFPQHATTLSPSTLALTCLLHDLGTSAELLSATRMSFEFYGALKAMELLRGLGARADQAEAVGEAIIRHQDLGIEGRITLLGQAVQLATIYDNVGEYPTIQGFGNLLHHDTRADVNAAFPREGWLRCFADVIRKEEGLKPWCHSTHIPGFDDMVEANLLMRPYE